MIGTPPVRRDLPHLFGALMACGIALLLIFSGRVAAIRLERQTIGKTAPEDFFIKNQGLAFQRAAAQAANVVLLYGSSELTDPIPNRAADYFARAPSGFEVCPVGKPGATSLIILQKLAALGSDLRDRKVALSISPSFFFRHDVTPEAYAGNFSLPAASALIFGHGIDWQLKSDIAKRMLQFPDTLAKSKLLDVAAQHLASDSVLDRVFLTAIWPLGQLQNLVFDFQDHFEALVYILSGGKKIPRHEVREILGAEEDVGGPVAHPGREKGVGTLARRGEEVFRSRITGATEWNDMELLFRTLREVGAHAIVLSMPLDGPLYDQEGISRSARQVYYDKLKDLAGKYKIDLIEFEDHDEDPSFQIARREHPTPRGWQYYNRALDNFFHQNDTDNREATWRR